MTEEKRKLIDENGIRTDGRRWDELRPLKIEVGVLRNADGSAGHVRGVDVLRVRDGKVVEKLSYVKG